MNKTTVSYNEERKKPLWTVIKYGIAYPLAFILVTGFFQWLLAF